LARTALGGGYFYRRRAWVAARRPEGISESGLDGCQENQMGKGKIPVDLKRVMAEKRRDRAAGLQAGADHDRDNKEAQRIVAEGARHEAEQFRVRAEEARVLREQYREELEWIRQEREALRHGAESARHAAEEARHAVIASVAATADALKTNLAQMQFLEDAWNTLRALKVKKPGPTTQ
jgi:hypothetical protein